MSQICQVCQKHPAKELAQRADGRRQWRCKTCLDRKKPAGFTIKKKVSENAK